MHRVIWNYFIYLSRAIRFFIAPPFCAYCKIFLWHDTILCAVCRNKIQPIVSHDLPITNTRLMRVFAISAYRDPVRRLILAKSVSNCAVAYQLGQLMWELTDIQYQQFDYIIPVPLHWTRYAWRGYNQAYEMGCALSKNSGIPVLDALKRIRATKQQSAMKGHERVSNVANVFQARVSIKDRLKGKRILLVDDLMTSGSTLRACAKELYAYHAADVMVVVVSRVI